MTPPRKFLVDHPVAQRLADLAGIEHDLEIVARTCDLFLGSPSVGSQEALVRSNAIAAFAIINYFRTLANGVRSGVSKEQIDQLPEKLQNTHARLKNVRDHYLAHSINRQESNIVEVSLKEDGTIASLCTTHSRPATFSVDDMTLLKTLAEAVKKIIKDEYNKEFDRVWDFVESLDENERKTAFREYKAPGVFWDWHQTRRRLGA
jgi:hypothetical protein